jgi:hypothetical protein
MSQWIYEQDLISQKYRILIAMRHDRIIRQIAAHLGIGLQELRKYIIEHYDMILLENLPARYEAAFGEADTGDPVAQALGRNLYTTYVPLVPGHVMDTIYWRVDSQVQSGVPLDVAAAGGRAMIREAMGQ